MSLLSLLTFSFISLSTVAAQSPSEKHDLKKLEKELVKTLKLVPENESIEEALDNFLMENAIISDDIIIDPIPGAKTKEYSNPETPFDIEKHLDKKIKEGKFRNYKINDNVELIFTDGFTFFFSELKVKNNKKRDSREGEFFALSSGSKHAEHSYVAKNWTGLTLWTAYTSGWFNYNGFSVSAVEDESSITRGTLSFWNVTNETSDAKRITSQLSEVYVSGNCSWGYYIAGQGLTMQDIYVKVYIRGDHKGNITKDKTLR